MDQSVLSSVYVQVGNTAGNSYRAMVVDIQIRSVLIDVTNSVNRYYLRMLHSGGLFLPVVF